MKRIDPADYAATGASASAGHPFGRLARTQLRDRVCPVVLLSGDMLAFVIAAFLAFAASVAARAQPFARAIDNVSTLGSAWQGWGTLLVLASLLCYLSARGHYTSRVPFWTQMEDVLLGTAVALSCDTFIRVAVYGQPVVVEGLLRWVIFAPSVLALRVGARAMLRTSGLWSIRTLIIAHAGVVDQAKAALLSDHGLGYRLAGALDLDDAAALGEDDLINAIDAQGGEFVVVAVSGGRPAAERAVVATLRRARLPMAIVPALEGLPVVGFRQHYFFGHDIVMLVSRNNLARPFSRMLKATFDQVVAAVFVLLLAPLLLALALMVRADGGPALFRHRRIGAGGRTFACLKFRTMVLNADQILNRVISTDAGAAAEWAATQKLSRDPRVTRVGQFLRRSSLDELPQLFNVVRGEMSLVGPRPIVQAEIARYGTDIEFYYETKPGLTGMWQVSGRSDTSYERRVRLDVWYVRNWTLWHDIAILLKTIPAVFLQRGAR